MALTEPKTIQIGDSLLLDVVPGREDLQVRMVTPTGEFKTTVKKVDLWAAVFAIVDGKMQDDLMPVRQTQMVTFERMHHVRVKRDLKKGDVLKFKTKVDVPLTIVESLKGMLPEGAASGGPTIHTGGGDLKG